MLRQWNTHQIFKQATPLSSYIVIMTHHQSTTRTSIMKTYASITLLNLALLTVHAAEQKDINASCNEVWGIIGCSRNIQYPSFARATFGR